MSLTLGPLHFSHYMWLVKSYLWKKCLRDGLKSVRIRRGCAWQDAPRARRPRPRGRGLDLRHRGGPPLRKLPAGLLLGSRHVGIPGMYSPSTATIKGRVPPEAAEFTTIIWILRIWFMLFRSKAAGMRMARVQTSGMCGLPRAQTPTTGWPGRWPATATTATRTTSSSSPTWDSRTTGSPSHGLEFCRRVSKHQAQQWTIAMPKWQMLIFQILYKKS